MMRGRIVARWPLALALVIVAIAVMTEVPEAQEVPQLDQYGGYVGLVASRGATGFFRVEKVGNRWMFVTPDGNAFWMRAVYHANERFLERGVIEKKYGGDVTVWATQRSRRLLAWGFNTLGEYTSTRGLPVGVWGSRTGNEVKLPFILLLNTSLDALQNPGSLGLPDPMKDIIAGVPRTTYSGYRAPLADYYDPMYLTALRKEIAYWSRAITGGFADTPWIVGITPDDADKMFGFKSRAGNVFQPYPHPGFFVATTKFHYTPSEHPQSRPWLDPRLHSKYAWIQFLRAKYNGDIAALNAAWGTRGFYTSFDDEGGYGQGTGVLDEDGRHTAWIGSMSGKFDNAGATPGFKADIDAFLYQFARYYAQVTVAGIRTVDKNHLIFGPAALNNYGSKARDEVLQGLADGGIDVFQWNYDPRTGDMSENGLSYDLVRKPAFIWYTVTANADSPWAASSPFWGAPDFRTQGERGRRYASDLGTFLNARGANGDHYVIGIDWWELVDTKSAAEKANMGLTTHKDNAYDGTEAIRAPGTDPWGFPTGGEAKDYGDFLSWVIKAHRAVYSTLFSGRAGSRKQ